MEMSTNSEITAEDAIAWFEKRKAAITMSGANRMYEKAIAALRAQAKAEKNEPLTLEEPWQAKKQWEPVYAVSVDGADIFPKRWSVPCVLDCTVAYGCGQTESIVAIYGKNLTLSESEYGRTWLAYRRKPENGRH